MPLSRLKCQRRRRRSTTRLPTRTASPTAPATNARPSRCAGSSSAAAGTTVRRAVQRTHCAVVVVLAGAEDFRAGLRPHGHEERERDDVVALDPPTAPAGLVPRERGSQPAGAAAAASSTPGGAWSSSEVVARGARSFGVSKASSVDSPSLDEGRRDRDVRRRGGGGRKTRDECRDEAPQAASDADRSGSACARRCDEDIRARRGFRLRSGYSPSSRAITRRWTSFVPSPISRIFWSR